MVSILRPHYRLPVELYRPIFEQVVSAKDLCALSTTSRYAQIEAERLLYYHMEGHGIADIIATCKHICHLPRVGNYVQSLVLGFPDSIRFCYVYLLRSFSALVAQALHRTPNLIRLCILTHTSPSFRDGLYRIPISKFWSFKLRHFCVSYPDNHRHIFTKFLPGQHNIRYLDLTPLDAEDLLLVILPSHVLPRTICLKTMLYDTMIYFLTQRSLTHLSVGSLLNGRADNRLQGAGLQVKALHCSLAIAQVPVYFPRLELLSFKLLSHEFDGESKVVPTHYADWAIVKQMISQLKQLRRFAFIYTDDRRCDVADVVQALVAFRNVCPTLRSVQLRSDRDFPPPTIAYSRDWEWDGMTWVGLPVSESLDIWEQSAMEVAVSGISRVNYGLKPW